MSHIQQPRSTPPSWGTCSRRSQRVQNFTQMITATPPISVIDPYSDFTFSIPREIRDGAQSCSTAITGYCSTPRYKLQNLLFYFLNLIIFVLRFGGKILSALN